MKKKEFRNTVLYARIKPKNRDYLLQLKKEHGYKSLSEFMDLLIEQMKEKKSSK